jgi:CHAT domain-containing protein
MMRGFGKRGRKRLFWLGLVVWAFMVVTAVPVIAQHRPIFSSLPTLNQIVNVQENSQSLKANDASTLLAQGKSNYDTGRFADALVALQQAQLAYEQASDRQGQAISLNYLSLAYQKLGQWEQAEAAITQSLDLLRSLPNAAILAQALTTQGSIQLATGQTQAALQTWQDAEKAYAQAGDEIGVLGSKINQAQAWQSLGMFRRAQTLLEQVQQAIASQPNSSVKVTGLRSLGLVWQAVGDLQQSQTLLEESLAVARSINSTSDISAALLSLGNTVRGLGKIQEALQYYQQAAITATNPLLQLKAQLNQLKLLIQSQELTQAQALLPSIQTHLSNLPLNRDAIYARVNLAESLMQLVGTQGLPSQQDIAQLLAKAVQDAKSLNDPRAESLALGSLGELYEQTQQLGEAQRLTQQALLLSQTINAADISYQWQWQLARVLTRKGEIENAIAANQQAVDSLKSLRGDLVATNPDVRFSFEQEIEPIYRHLVSLLLPRQGENGGVSQENLKQARNVIESLQLAELENFFRTACLNAKAEQIDKVIEKSDARAAVIYPIILPDRLAVIVSLPGQPLHHYSTDLPQADVEETISQMRQAMSPAISNRNRLRVSQSLYNWLIRPIEASLAENSIKTLVFVLDGVLRNVPMAALHDGQQYLIEKYSVVLTPGLQLLEPRSLKQLQLRSLTGGLTEPRLGFSALPAVEQEVEQISTNIPSQVLLNEAFTRTTLENQLTTRPTTVVHLATHGQFSSKPEETFLLTWDGRLGVNTLAEVLKSREQRDSEPIELLVLSACETAIGDKRAALGLAGLAVRSGVRSTIATLWSVKDQSTAELMVEFYRHLVQIDGNRAEALRQAQLLLLQQNKYQHPYFWAPFVLVGNWL